MVIAGYTFKTSLYQRLRSRGRAQPWVLEAEHYGASAFDAIGLFAIISHARPQFANREQRETADGCGHVTAALEVPNYPGSAG